MCTVCKRLQDLRDMVRARLDFRHLGGGVG
jgi:hypothetical protein